jgi:hypothetical protein
MPATKGKFREILAVQVVQNRHGLIDCITAFCERR